MVFIRCSSFSEAKNDKIALLRVSSAFFIIWLLDLGFLLQKLVWILMSCDTYSDFVFPVVLMVLNLGRGSVV